MTTNPTINDFELEKAGTIALESQTRSLPLESKFEKRVQRSWSWYAKQFGVVFLVLVFTIVVVLPLLNYYLLNYCDSAELSLASFEDRETHCREQSDFATSHESHVFINENYGCAPLRRGLNDYNLAGKSVYDIAILRFQNWRNVTVGVFLSYAYLLYMRTSSTDVGSVGLFLLFVAQVAQMGVFGRASSMLRRARRMVEAQMELEAKPDACRVERMGSGSVVIVQDDHIKPDE